MEPDVHMEYRDIFYKLGQEIVYNIATTREITRVCDAKVFNETESDVIGILNRTEFLQLNYVFNDQIK